MKELESIVENIRSVFDDGSYPADLLKAYDQMECLSSHSGRETFLVRGKEDGRTAVAKCYDLAVFPIRSDFDPLKGLSHPGLPRFFGQYKNAQMLCVVREYIDGVSLKEYAREKRLSVQEIVSILDGVCDILAFLHGQDPPVIHRDIKPENIIIRPDGTPALIDFDICRTYRENAAGDTVCFGTRGYAPPEQYGFSQTDCRADIYAFGVLLRFLLTRSTEENPNVTIDGRLKKVIDKCTAFSPEDRYADIGEVRRDLARAGKGKMDADPRRALILFAALLCALLAGFAAGRYTSWFSPVREIAFSEPLIERAVRLRAGREHGPLTEEDLAGVRSIYIYGSEAYADPEEYFRQHPDMHGEGSLRSLDDLKMLSALEEVYIVRQGDVDISALREMLRLTKVEFKHMRISSAQPLGCAVRLRFAVLFDVGLTDATDLENCPWLEELDIGGNGFKSMDRIGFHPAVRSLGLMWCGMDSLEGIAERFPNLRAVTVRHSTVRDISALRDLRRLEAVYVSPDRAEEARALFAGTDVMVEAGD